jgi:hypothetical protein
MLSDERREARINALTTAATYLETFDWSNFDEGQTTEEEYELFLDECKKMHKRLEKQAEKLRKGDER